MRFLTLPLVWAPCAIALSSSALSSRALSPSAAPRARLDRRAFHAALAGLASLAPAAPAAAAARDPIISNCRKAKPGEADVARAGQILRARGKVVCDVTEAVDEPAVAAAAAAARAPRSFGTETGIVYYDVGRFDDPSARTPLRARSRVLLDYALRADGFDGAPGASAPARATFEFILGDGLENDAVDELVRSMVPGTTRRATVPAAFGLGGGGSQSAPSYLELNVRAVLGKGEYREEERAAQRCDEGEPLPVLCKPPPQQRVGGG